MQVTQQIQTANTNVTKVNGYQLTTALLRGGLGKLGLSNTTGLVLLYLASCYNGGVIYPKVNTIADNVGISAISVKRAIAELLRTNCIMKSKRHNGTNANCYVLTQKILSRYHPDTNKSITMIPTCKKSYHDKLEQQHDEVAVFLGNSSLQGVEEQTQNGTSRTAEPVCSQTSFDLNTIPSIILNNPKVRNAQKYWGSLRPAVKIKYWQEQQKKDNLKKERAEQEKAEAENKAREKAELEAELSKPLHEQWTKQQAIKHIWLLRNFRKVSATGLTADLINLYNLNPTEIWGMSAEETEGINK